MLPYVLINCSRSTQTKPLRSYPIRSKPTVSKHTVSSPSPLNPTDQNLLPSQNLSSPNSTVDQAHLVKTCHFQNLSLTVKTFHQLILLLPYSLSGQSLALKKNLSLTVKTYHLSKPETCEGGGCWEPAGQQQE